MNTSLPCSHHDLVSHDQKHSQRFFVDLARNVFIAVHVDDLIMVGSSSQLYEVVGEMKHYFTMKVTRPLSTSSTQTYVGAQHLRHGDAIWELPTTRCVTGMLNEHGMQDAKPVVNLPVNRNDDDDEEEEASAEEHRSLRRLVGKSQLLGPRRPDTAFTTQRLARSLAKPSEIGHHCVETSLAISAGYDGFRTEATSTKQSVLNPDSVHRQRLGWRSTHTQVGVFVGDHAGCILAQARTQSVIAQSSCEAEYIEATAATSEAKYIQSLFLACGQHVNIHLRSDRSGATGVASRRGLQRLRHLDVRFLWLQAQTGKKNVRISKVPGPENVADANTKPADRRSLEFCRLNMASQRSRNSFAAVLWQVRHSFPVAVSSLMLTCAATAIKFCKQA